MSGEIPTFLSQNQLLKALGLKSPHTIAKLVGSGHLPAPINLGGVRRWPASVLADLAAGRKPGAAA